MKTWLIVGATSGIARQVARELAERGATLFLAGRNDEQLAQLAEDLRVRTHAAVSVGRYDALATPDPAAFVEEVEKDVGALDGVVWAVGTMDDSQVETQTDVEAARRTIEINFTAGFLLLNAVAEKMESRRQGMIVAIGSVAGDRGRAKNYTYGAAKAGLHAALQGMRQRLAKAGVHVLTVKPGFVRTAMLEGQEGTFLVANPRDVATDIAKAIDRKSHVLYTPWFWRVIMTTLRHVPEAVFKRLNI